MMPEENDNGLTPRERAFLKNNPGTRLSNTGGAKKLIGIEGWLSLLVVSLLILGPLFVIFLTFTSAPDEATRQVNEDAWRIVRPLEWVTAIIYCAMSIFAGYLLLKKQRKSTPRIVIALLWLGGPMLTTIGVILAGYAFGYEGVIAQVLPRQLVRPVIFATIWTLYLLISRRVRNTYQHEGRAEVGKVFS